MNGNKFGYALLMQILLIGSIYVIYFRSTVIKGLEAVPQDSLSEPAPAKRLVIFILDDLRAKEFFENNCNNVPYLRQLFLNQGLVGIIRNRSRHSFMSIFSGFNQDPPLVWPAVPFDTVFNRSARTYAWSSESLDPFPHIKHRKVVKVKVPFEAKKQSYKLDEVVFQFVNQFISKPSILIKSFNAIIYLIHLVGLKSAQDWETYRENLNYTEHEIWNTYHRFERSFPDQTTAYLLVSHSGCHDDTPVFVWGSGVAHTRNTLGRNFSADNQKLPLHTFDYIQLTPLISALLGISIPVNNRGMLPMGMLNTSTRYEAFAMRMNTFQILAQAKHLVMHHHRGWLSDILPKFWLNNNLIDNFVSNVRLLSVQHRFHTLMEYTANFIPVFLKCIDYYQLYYQRMMLMATICGICGWLYNLQFIQSESKEIPTRRLSIYFQIFKGFILLSSLLMLVFVIIQQVPWLVVYALLLPILMWILALRAHEKRKKPTVFLCKNLFWPIVLALCCVVGFNSRRHVLGLTYLGFALYNNRRAFRSHDFEFYLWLLLVFGLTGITWLPPSLGCVQRNLLLASISLTFLRPLAFGMRNNRKTWICNGLILLAAFMHILYRPAPWIMNMISWTYLCYIFIRRPFQSIDELSFNLCTLYSLMCTSYEALVIQLLATELGLRLKLKNSVKISASSNALHTMLYSCYSFLVLGNISTLGYVQESLEFTCFGNQSFTSALVIGIKLMLPSFLLFCIFENNCKDQVRVQRNVFHWHLSICNIMAMVFLFRNRNLTLWKDISSNIINFLIVQLWPLLLMLQRSLAQFVLDVRHQPDLPKCKTTALP